jgi:hypothetical protein
MQVQDIISDFQDEFGAVAEKFEIMDLLSNGSEMRYNTIESLKMPSPEYNIVWHPGVYFFIGNSKLYRVGVSMRNSRARVLQHLKAGTGKDGYNIWDIDKFNDKSILIINVKNREDRHWLLAIEAYFEMKYKPLIRAGRIG